MSSTIARQTLDAVWSLILASKDRGLTQEERSKVKGLCVALSDGVKNRPICSHAMREFAEEVSTSGLVLNGQAAAADLDALLKKARSLKFLVG